MKKYIQPEMEIEEFDVQDIITSSVGETVMHDVVVNDDGDDTGFFSN